MVYYTPVNSTGYDMNQTYYVAKTYYTPESDDSDVVYYVPTNSTYDMNQTYYVAHSYYSEDSDSDEQDNTSDSGSDDSDTSVDLEPIKSDAERWKDEGNAAFNNKQYDVAIQKYEDALAAAEVVPRSTWSRIAIS